MRTAPYNLISWTNPTPLGANFREYNIWARPAVFPTPRWAKIATYSGSAYPWLTPAQVEANLTKFRDYMAGWGGVGSPWEMGWEYQVTVVNRTTRLESRIFGSTVERKALTPTLPHWFTCNEAPYLNFPASVLDIEAAPSSDHMVKEDGLAGRKYSFTRAYMERAGRTQTLNWYYHSLESLPEELARWPYAMADSGRTTALLVPFGDRYLGSLNEVKVSRSGGDGTKMGVDAELIETEDWQLAGYNLPPGHSLNGTSQYVSVASATALNPTTAAFSLVASGIFPSASGKVHASKGNIGTAASYGFRNPSANAISFYVKGATAVVEATYTPGTNPLTPFDSKQHALVGTYDGAEARLWLDGVLVAGSKGVAGSVTNSVALVFGANNGGAAGWSAIAPWYSGAEYGYKLTDAQALAACGYLLAWSGYKMPGGGNVFLDGRDSRCYTGAGTTMEDLSGNLRRGTIVAAPLYIGKPYALSELDILVPVA